MSDGSQIISRPGALTVEIVAKRCQLLQEAGKLFLTGSEVRSRMTTSTGVARSFKTSEAEKNLDATDTKMTLYAICSGSFTLRKLSTLGSE